MIATVPEPVTANVAEPPLLPTLTFLHRFTKEQYQAMEEAGILPHEKKFELLDGLILEKAVPSPEHQFCCRMLIEELKPRLPDQWYLEVQSTGDLGDSQPEPDGMIYLGNSRTYATTRPESADIALVIEVSLTTLRTDRREKGWKYAEAGIPVYWIINLEEKCIEVYSNPQAAPAPAKYGTRSVYVTGQEVPVVLGGKAVTVIPAAELLP